MKKNNILIKNIGISIVVQFFALIVSFLMNLIIPKIVSTIQYAYWQSYYLYIGYIGILHFGVLDGIVLRYAQYDYDQLPYSSIKSQYSLVLKIDIILAIIIYAVIYKLCSWPYYIIGFFVCISIVVKHFFTFSSYLFQLTNRISNYAKLIFLQKLINLLIIIVLLITEKANYLYFCIADLFADFFSALIMIPNNWRVFSSTVVSTKKAFDDYKESLTAGKNLVLANWSSLIIIGFAKTLIQLKWEEDVFAKTSFSFSVTNMFLTLVTAVSVAFFPSLKREKTDEIINSFHVIRRLLDIVLFFFLCLFYPGAYILKWWLPKYEISLYYLGILLPMIIYTAKNTLLNNNYMKVFRKEQKLTRISILTVIISFILYLISIYLCNSVELTMAFVVLAVATKSIYTELIIMNIIGNKDFSSIFWEASISIVFICSNLCKNTFLRIVFFLYVGLYFVKELKQLLKKNVNT